MNFWRLCIPESEFNRQYKGGFGKPECWKCEIPVVGQETGHKGITSNWVDAIRKQTPLLAPGAEGINGLMLSNAMYLSEWTGNKVELPIDEDLFLEKLQEKIKHSRYKKGVNGVLNSL